MLLYWFNVFIIFYVLIMVASVILYILLLNVLIFWFCKTKKHKNLFSFESNQVSNNHVYFCIFLGRYRQLYCRMFWLYFSVTTFTTYDNKTDRQKTVALKITSPSTKGVTATKLLELLTGHNYFLLHHIHSWKP